MLTEEHPPVSEPGPRPPIGAAVVGANDTVGYSVGAGVVVGANDAVGYGVGGGVGHFSGRITAMTITRMRRTTPQQMFNPI